MYICPNVFELLIAWYGGVSNSWNGTHLQLICVAGAVQSRWSYLYNSIGLISHCRSCTVPYIHRPHLLLSRKAATKLVSARSDRG